MDKRSTPPWLTVKTHEGRRYWQKHADKTETVRRIFQLALEGQSENQIAEALRGTPRLKEGGPWTRKAVNDVLKDERVVSRAFDMPPVVMEDEYERAQAISRARFSEGVPNLFASIGFCICGSSVKRYPTSHAHATVLRCTRDAFENCDIAPFPYELAEGLAVELLQARQPLFFREQFEHDKHQMRAQMRQRVATQRALPPAARVPSELETVEDHLRQIEDLRFDEETIGWASLQDAQAPEARQLLYLALVGGKFTFQFYVMNAPVLDFFTHETGYNIVVRRDGQDIASANVPKGDEVERLEAIRQARMDRSKGLQVHDQAKDQTAFNEALMLFRRPLS